MSKAQIIADWLDTIKETDLTGDLTHVAAELRRLDALNAELIHALEEIRSGRLPHPRKLNYESLLDYHVAVANGALARAKERE